MVGRGAVFLFLKALTWRGALTLLDAATHPRYTLPISFIAVIRPDRVPEVCEVIRAITKRVVDRLVRESIRSDREKLKPKRKRAWSQTKTRCPIRHHVERLAGKVPLEHLVDLAKEAARKTEERHGPPWTPNQKGERGRPPRYDPTLQAASLLVKHRIESGFQGLSKKLRKVGFDARLPSRQGPPTPSPETLYRAFRLTPTWWLDEAIAQLDRMVTKRYARRFGWEGLNTFALDSTGLGLQSLMVVERALKRVLAHGTLYVAAAARLLTNTVVAVGSGRGLMRNAKPFILHLPAGAVLVADSEFDSEANYELAAEHGIRLVCKPVRHGEKIGGRFRRRAADAFDQSIYRRRKLVERVFGNISSRRVGSLAYRLPETRAKAVRLIAAGHNLGCLLMVEALSELFQPL